MVKHVVKPLLLRILRESRVPKKSVFTRLFGVFCFGIPWGRCPAPKAPALPTAPHPDIFDFVYLFLLDCPRSLLPLPHHTSVTMLPRVLRRRRLLSLRCIRHRRRSGTSQLRHTPLYLILFICFSLKSCHTIGQSRLAKQVVRHVPTGYTPIF